MFLIAGTLAMFFAAQEEIGKELCQSFRMCIVRLMTDQWQDCPLGLRQGFLKFFKIGPGYDAVFIALGQQNRCLDFGKDRPEVKASDQIKPVGERADGRAGILLNIMLPAVVNFFGKVQPVVICQHGFVQRQTA